MKFSSFRRYLSLDVTTIDLDISTFCNMRCLGCLRQTRPIPGRYLSAATVPLMLKALRSFRHVNSIHLVGMGEPTLNPEFGNIAKTLAEYGLPLDLTTNGSCLDSEQVLSSCALFRNINVSLDAATGETYHRVRGVAFQSVIDNIGLLIRRKPECPANMTVRLSFIANSQNIQEIGSFIDLAKKLGVDEIYFENSNSPWYPDDVYHEMIRSIALKKNGFPGKIVIKKRRMGIPFTNAIIGCSYFPTHLKLDTGLLPVICPFIDEPYGPALDDGFDKNEFLSKRREAFHKIKRDFYSPCKFCNHRLG
jgi:MoaA/NifB/PqqE/SkfB family radical SAM enzyme